MDKRLGFPEFLPRVAAEDEEEDGKSLLATKPKIYFGQPVNVYHTELQRRLIRAIKRRFREYTLVNPDTKKHDAGYKRRKAKTGVGLDYFLEEVLPGCDAGIFLPFRGGQWSSGAFLEAQSLHGERGCPIWKIDQYEHITKVIDLNQEVALTRIESTWRVRDAMGRRIPYEAT